MAAETTSLGELFRLFFRLGLTAFGGPAAHIAMMRSEVVLRRSWLSEDEFLDLVGAVNLIPGPNSTEMAIHIGRARRGLKGLVTAGVAFIAPASVLSAALAWLYQRYGNLPEASAFLYGTKPVILAVIAQAIVALAPRAARNLPLRLLGLLAVAAAAFGVHELAVLFGSGALAMLILPSRPRSGSAAFAPLGLGNMLGGAMLGSASALLPTAGSIFLVFLKTGAVLFGSGYVLVAFLRQDLVVRLGWLTEAQLVDAVMVGQVTPGPVFSTATFVGWLLGGPPGALAATLGIFLPAFVLVALSAPLLPRLRRSPFAAAFLDGVNVASLALMLVVTALLARAAVVDAWTAALAVTSAILLLLFRVNSAWLVLGGAVLGHLIRAVT